MKNANEICTNLLIKLISLSKKGKIRLRVVEVRAKNFRSIEDETVHLSNLSILVGTNASGKSNFLDILNFLGQSLRDGLTLALDRRGGFNRISRKIGGRSRPYDVTCGVKLKESEQVFDYEIKLGSEKTTGVSVKREKLTILQNGTEHVKFDLYNGKWKIEPSGVHMLPPKSGLALTLLSGMEQYQEVYDFLRRMAFYRLYPDKLAAQQPPDIHTPLRSEGENLASVLRELKKGKNPEFIDDLEESLEFIIPDVKNLDVKMVSGKLIIQLVHEALTKKNKIKQFKLDLDQESDGTQRILGLLTAIYQDPPPSLLAIEEPELTIHTAAMRLIAELLVEATERYQVLITSHNRDLLNLFEAKSILVVERKNGITRIGPLDPEQREVIEKKLFGPGDLVKSEGLKRKQDE